jgi:hypothetical protein
MKFDAEDPDEVSKSGGQVDRSQGAAKAITVSAKHHLPLSYLRKASGLNTFSGIHRPWVRLERHPVVQEHHEEYVASTGVICPSLTILGALSASHPQGCAVLGGETTIMSPITPADLRSKQDALEAYDQSLAGVVLSNHGGRQLDFARSGIEVLVEVVEKFQEKRGITFPNPRFQLFVDGGVRRATDVLKAVALGATAGKHGLALGVGNNYAELIATQSGLVARSSTRSQRMVRRVSRKHFRYCMYV